MYAFAGKINFDIDGNLYLDKFGHTISSYESIVPRQNFDNLGFAFMTVFQVLSAENWQ